MTEQAVVENNPTGVNFRHISCCKLIPQPCHPPTAKRTTVKSPPVAAKRKRTRGAPASVMLGAQSSRSNLRGRTSCTRHVLAPPQPLPRKQRCRSTSTIGRAPTRPGRSS
jgi:hypothetical protein